MVSKKAIYRGWNHAHRAVMRNPSFPHWSGGRRDSADLGLSPPHSVNKDITLSPNHGVSGDQIGSNNKVSYFSWEVWVVANPSSRNEELLSWMSANREPGLLPSPGSKEAVPSHFSYLSDVRGSQLNRKLK